MSLHTHHSRDRLTVAVRQSSSSLVGSEEAVIVKTPVLVVEEDDGSITVHVIPNVTIKTVDRTVDLGRR